MSWKKQIRDPGGKNNLDGGAHYLPRHLGSIREMAKLKSQTGVSMKYSIRDLIYQGEKSGAHNWNTMSGTAFYWHPDWLHIAEDMTGHKATATIAPSGDKATQDEAVDTIVTHLNTKG